MTVVRRLVEHGPDIIARYAVERGRCVLASRVAFDVLRGHGIEAEPIAVQFAVMNRAYLEWAARPGRTLEQFRDSGAWLVSNAMQWRRILRQPPLPREGFVPYHVVLELPALGLLLDLDLRQTEHAHRGITPPAALAIAWDGHRAERRWSWGAALYTRWPHDIAAEIPTLPFWARGPYPAIAAALEERLESVR